MQNTIGRMRREMGVRSCQRSIGEGSLDSIPPAAVRVRVVCDD
jgi:hypothetical protein